MEQIKPSELFIEQNLEKLQEKINEMARNGLLYFTIKKKVEGKQTLIAIQKAYATSEKQAYSFYLNYEFAQLAGRKEARVKECLLIEKKRIFFLMEDMSPEKTIRNFVIKQAQISMKEKITFKRIH